MDVCAAAPVWVAAGEPFSIGKLSSYGCRNVALADVGHPRVGHGAAVGDGEDFLMEFKREIGARV